MKKLVSIALLIFVFAVTGYSQTTAVTLDPTQHRGQDNIDSRSHPGLSIRNTRQR